LPPLAKTVYKPMVGTVLELDRAMRYAPRATERVVLAFAKQEQESRS
jgi:DNA helicase HerA-like ATPase